MSDWSSCHSRSRAILEYLAWLLSAALVMLLVASSTALAMWFQRNVGLGNQPVTIVSLAPLEATAVGEEPGPAPITTDAAPDAPDAPDLDEELPTPETVTEEQPDFDQPDLPDLEELAENLPDTTPPPEPEPEVQKAEVEKPKPVERKKVVKKKQAEVAKQVQEEKGKKSHAQTAQQSGGASAAGSRAMLSAMQKWQSRVQTILHRRVGGHGFGAGGEVVLVIRVTADGAIAGVTISGTTGNATADTKIAARARGAQLPPPPDGQARSLTLRVTDN